MKYYYKRFSAIFSKVITKYNLWVCLLAIILTSLIAMSSDQGLVLGYKPPDEFLFKFHKIFKFSFWLAVILNVIFELFCCLLLLFLFTLKKRSLKEERSKRSLVFLILFFLVLYAPYTLHKNNMCLSEFRSYTHEEKSQLVYEYAIETFGAEKIDPENCCNSYKSNVLSYDPFLGMPDFWHYWWGGNLFEFQLKLENEPHRKSVGVFLCGEVDDLSEYWLSSHEGI